MNAKCENKRGFVKNWQLVQVGTPPTPKHSWSRLSTTPDKEKKKEKNSKTKTNFHLPVLQPLKLSAEKRLQAPFRFHCFSFLRLSVTGWSVPNETQHRPLPRRAESPDTITSASSLITYGRFENTRFFCPPTVLIGRL